LAFSSLNVRANFDRDSVSLLSLLRLDKMIAIFTKPTKINITYKVDAIIKASAVISRNILNL